MACLQLDPLDPAILLGRFCADRRDVGAVASFTGLVRDMTDGQAVSTLTLDAAPGVTEQVMGQIEAEARSRFDVIDVLAVHRWGVLSPGEPIIFVAAAAAHRRDALLAVDFLMDQFKVRAPLWKREDGAGERRWIAPRNQDHSDLARWAPKPETP